MIPTRTLIATACIAGLSGLMPASAHHIASQPRHYLAFWGDYRPPDLAEVFNPNCREERFWVKGFVSLYPQGGYFSKAPEDF